MPVPFAKTLTFLEGEQPTAARRSGLVVLGLLTAWGGWIALSRTTVYSVSEEGRLLADGAASPVQAPIAGVIVENVLVLGAQVQAGDVLARLDAQSIGSPTPIADAQAGDRGRSPKGRVGRRGRTTSPRGKPTFLATLPSPKWMMSPFVTGSMVANAFEPLLLAAD